MENAIQTVNWKSYVFISLAAIIVILALSVTFHLPVLTAIPIGFLFGFFLQKGDLCGASAFSEVLLMKSWKKTWGLWICIVTGMAGFAVLDLLGLVTLNPKPFQWANILIGGILFGVGMVLSGGCISGSLYKAGIGHINSIVSLVGIPIGIALVEYGSLSKINGTLKTEESVSMVDCACSQPRRRGMGFSTAFRPGALHSQTSRTDIRGPDRLNYRRNGRGDGRRLRGWKHNVGSGTGERGNGVLCHRRCFGQLGDYILLSDGRINSF